MNFNSKVLLIESDLEVSMTITNWLKDYAEIFHIANDSESDIRSALKNKKWNLIITDVNLPDFNDIHITNIAKAQDSTISVLIITENKKINFILDALQDHVDGLIFKPLEKDKFLVLANKLINNSINQRIRERKIVLAIGAHPDDVEIGCGGTLAWHHAEGDQLNILTLSLGGLGGDPLIRKKEAENAAVLQHAQLHLGNFIDTNISEGKQTIAAIEEVVNKVQPTHVYTHSAHDNHQDHRNVYSATVTACRQIPNLYCYQSPSTTVYFRPNLYKEIDNYIENKLEVLAIYKSQSASRAYLQPDLIRATARYWGRFSNFKLVEPMEVIRQRS